MLKYGPCSKQLHRNAIQLSKKIFKENMDKQFRLLFDDSNRKHMFISTDENKVVSMVNYYRSTVQIHGARTNVASIGSVCTLEEYRHQSIASTLLKMAEKKMLSEEVSVAIISGDGGLYRQFGSDIVGDMVGYIITRNDIPKSDDLTIRPFHESLLEEVMALYVNEPIRFLRSLSEFKSLILGQTYPDTFADYPFYLVYNKGKLISYIIFSRAFGKRTLLVKEFGGSRSGLAQAFGMLLIELKKISMTIVCSPQDELNEYLKMKTPQKTDLHASIKIVNPMRLYFDLMPYFKLKCKNEVLSQLGFSAVQDKYKFQYKNEQPLYLDVHTLNKLFFGPNKNIIKKVKSESFKNVLNELFPIPFVWVNNLNYQ